MKSILFFLVTNMTLWVDTSAANGFKIPIKVNYAWPRIMASKVVVFPLTAIGNESYVDVPIHNPTNTPLFVHALMANDYGPNWVQHVQGNGVGGNITEGALVFSLRGLASDASQSNEKSAIFTEVQRSVVGDFMDTKPVTGVSFVIPPSAKFYLRCRFKPISKQLTSTLLIVRNNLTGVESTWLKGRAGTGLLTLGSGTPGSSLLFQITEKLLQGCEKESANKYLPPQLTVRRSFLARNIGDIPLNIDLVEIYPPQGYYWPGSWTLKQGESCEGFGFRILNCSPFTLQPNETHSIDIAYTPDFTMSRMVRSLRLLDSNGVYYNYTLVAMIPSGMLAICSTIITRPSWEPALKYVVIGVVFFLFMAASCLSYFDSSSIVSRAIVSTVRLLPGRDSNQGVGAKEETKVKLDLKAVYDKVDSRFKRSEQELLTQATSSSVPKTGQNLSQTSPPGGNPGLPSPVSTTSITPTTLNSTRPEPAVGLRNRKKVNTRTAAYLANELGAEKTSSTSKWIKTEVPEESRVSRDFQSTLSEDLSNNNNVHHAPEVKKNGEATGKKKGKFNVAKPKTGNKATASQTKNEDHVNGVETAIPDVPENLPAPITAELLPVVKSERKAPTKPTTSINGTVEDGVEKMQKPHTKKTLKVNAVVEQAHKVATQPTPKVTTESKIPPVKVPTESAPKVPPTQPLIPSAAVTISKGINEFVPKHGSSVGTSHAEVKRTIIAKQKQLSGSSSSGSHGSGSPVDFPSRSGTPWLSSQDGLNDFGTVPFRQNSALQRRASSGSGEGNPPQNFPSVPPGYNPIPNHAPQQPPGFFQQQFSSGGIYNTHHHQLQQQMAALQANSTYKNGNHPGTGTQNSSTRRPGVIGQPRQTPSIPQPSQQNLGFINGVLTTLSLTTPSNTATYRQSHGQATRTPSWNSELRALGMDSWTSRSSSELYPSSNIPFAKPPTSTPPPTNPNNEPYNLNSTLPADLLSSLWQMNAFDPIPNSTYRNAQVSGSNTAVSSSSSGHHRGFVPSSHSDTTQAHRSVFQQAQVENNWPTTTPVSYYQNNQQDPIIRSSSPFMSQALDNVQASQVGVGWSTAPTPPTTRTSPFDRAEWEALGTNSGRDTRAMNDIWQNTVPASRTYWPTTINEAVNRPASTNPISRPDPTQSTANGIGLQSQREIEAGLGFNPFGSNIWTPSDGQQGWAPPGSHRQ